MGPVEMGELPRTSWISALAVAVCLFSENIDASESPRGTVDEPVVEAPSAAPVRVRIVIVSNALPPEAVSDAVGNTPKTRFVVTYENAETFSFDQWYRARSSSSYDVNIWLLRLSEDMLGIYFATTVGDRFIARELRVSSPLDEMDREALSQVIETSLHALDEDAIAPMSREEAASLFNQGDEPPPDDVPTAQRTERTPESATPETPIRFRSGGTVLPDLRLAYALSRHSKQAGLLHGLGVLAGVDRMWDWGATGLGLDAKYVLPKEYQEGDLTLDSRSLVARLDLRVKRFMDERTALGTHAGVGFTTTWWSARSTGALEAESGSRSTTPTLAWGLFGQLRSSEVARFELGVGLEIDLIRQRYAVDRAGELVTFLKRDAVRPGAHLGICLF